MPVLAANGAKPNATENNHSALLAPCETTAVSIFHHTQTDATLKGTGRLSNFPLQWTSLTM